jgi:hypothetical protein
MRSKQFKLDSDINVKIVKNSRSRQIKLTITTDNIARISIPGWMPYMAGLQFANTKKEWIRDHLHPNQLYKDGQLIGKNHRIVFKTTSNNSISSKITLLEIIVYIPENINYASREVQSEILNSCYKAFKQEAQILLTQRVDQLASKYNFQYQSLKFRKLKSRWGSCDSHQNITLSLKLMELPWNLIDYVIVHELIHTKIMNHQNQFWHEFSNIVPNPKKLKNELKQYR